MRLILDANRLFAALIRDSAARRVLLNPSFEFIAPEYILHEVAEHKKELLDKSGLNDAEFSVIFAEVMRRVNIVTKRQVKQYFTRAKAIMRDIVVDDSVYLALSFAIANDGIWTEDDHFKESKSVRVWTTRDLLDCIE